MLERRGFLKSGFASLVLAGVAPVLLTSGRSRAADSELSLARFSAHVESWFEFVGAGTHHARLVEANDHPIDPRVDQFWLVFRGPSNDAIAEGLYQVRSPLGDSYTLFVEPAGSDAGGNLYRSQICRLRRLSACAG